MPRLYPWDTLKVGDTFKVAGTTAFKFRRQCANASRIFRLRFRCEDRDGRVIVQRVPDDWTGNGIMVFPDIDALGLLDTVFMPAKGRELGALQVQTLRRVHGDHAPGTFDVRQIDDGRDRGLLITRIAEAPLH